MASYPLCATTRPSGSGLLGDRLVGALIGRIAIRPVWARRSTESKMRVPRHKILDPEQNTAYVVPALILSFFTFAYSMHFGPVLVLAFYACWLPILMIAPELLLGRGLSRVLPLLALPALALISTAWSDVPYVTLRGAIQFSITVSSGLIAARLTSIPNLAFSALIGGLLILIYSFMYGNYSYDVIDGNYAFSGAFGSKNQLGYWCSITIIAALLIALVFHANLFWRIVALGVAAFAALTLQMSDSATSVIALIGALSVCVLAYPIASLPVARRGAMVVLAVVLVGMLIWAAVGLGTVDSVLAAFGKDATLTGRTYLWNQGIEFGGQNPVRGLGYYAFWTHGRPEAEVLWEEFYISTRMGFHFHNTLIEAYVGLGLLGVAVVAGLTLALLILPLRVIFSRHVTGSAIAYTGFAVLFIPRSLVEIDFLTPHALGSFLVPFLLLHMADRCAADRRARARPLLRSAPVGVRTH